MAMGDGGGGESQAVLCLVKARRLQTYPVRDDTRIKKNSVQNGGIFPLAFETLCHYKHLNYLFFNNLAYILFKKQLKSQVTKQRLLFVLLRR